MKDKIQKLAGLNQEVANLIKEEKMDEAIEKIAEIQELTKEMDEAVETPADPKADETQEVAKSEAIAKAEKELLEKYASLNISADTIKDLMDQFGALKDQMTSGLDTITKRLEVVESAKGISKQADEKVEKSASDNVWADLNILG